MAINKNQKDGMISIITASVIMIIMSLIIVGFSRVSIRNSRQEVDRRLNTQAFYAAESAINDASFKIKGGEISDNIDTCDKTGNKLATNPLKDNEIKDVAQDVKEVKYTCTLIDFSPTVLTYSNLTTDDSKIVKLKPSSSGDVIKRIVVSWELKDDTTGQLFGQDCSSVGYFPNNNLAADKWKDKMPPLLKLNVIQGLDTNTQMIANQSMVFAFPTKSGLSACSDRLMKTVDTNTYKNPKWQGITMGADCVNGALPNDGRTRSCMVEFTNLNINKEGYIQIMPYYHDRVVVDIKGFKKDPITNVETEVKLVGTQIMIDATGKVSDVVKRIQVRKNIDYQNPLLPEFSIHAIDGICKRYNVGLGFVNIVPGSATMPINTDVNSVGNPCGPN